LLVKKLDGDQLPSVNYALEKNNCNAKCNGAKQLPKHLGTLGFHPVGSALLQRGFIQGPFRSSFAPTDANCCGFLQTHVQTSMQKSLEQSGWIELLCLQLFSPASDAQNNRVRF